MAGQRNKRVIAALVLVAVGAFLVASLVTHDPREGPFPDFSAQAVRGNACGAAGAYVSAYALALVGWAALPAAGLLVAAGVLLIIDVRVTQVPMRSAGLALAFVAAVVGMALLSSSQAAAEGLYRAAPGRGGGAMGILAAGALYRGVGPTGTLILVILSLSLGALLTAGAELAALYRRAVARARPRRRAAQRVARPTAEIVRGVEPPAAQSLAGAGLLAAAEGPPGQEFEEDVAPEVEAEFDDEEGFEVDEFEVDEFGEETPEPVHPEPEIRRRPTGSADDSDLDQDLSEMLEGLGNRDPGDYQLPPITLLDPLPPSAPPEEDEAEIRERGRVLERTLREFKVEARVVGITRGPVITMYELSLAPGTKVSKVDSLCDDLAIALKAPNVRIVAPLPGRNTIGIEIPNLERELVGVRELMEDTSTKAEKMDIPLFLGKDTAGTPLVLDLAKCPHLLVAGSTGSGKSVAINAMISSILMTRKPAEVQFLLVDPKSVEFNQFARLPHLICPVLTDMQKAASVLKWACKKMDERYSLLSQTGVRNLGSYNQLGEDEIRSRLDPEGDAILDDVPFHMPHIVIIIDEFGELMMVAAKEVESSVIRLSQKARAVGIHLICATQRPSADVITGLIKSNLPARIAFQVASKTGSRIILDRNGADRLLGRGDMLLLPPGSSRLIRAQGSFVSDEELGRVVQFLESQGDPQFRSELREFHAQEGLSASSDNLYDEAVRVVVESQRGSVSLLQRRLGVGYSRAARLVDMMAEAGVVGDYRGSQARQVLMTMEQWEKAHAQASGS